MKYSKSNQFIGLVLVGIILIWSIWSGVSQYRSVKDYTATTMGKVIRFQESAHSTGRSKVYSYDMEWEYEVNGVMYNRSKMDTIGSPIRNISEGGVAEVMYNPSNPNESMLTEERFARKGNSGLKITIFGVMFLAYLGLWLKK